MRCIVGLWNPGEQYEYTRHNTWFILVNALREIWGFEDWKKSRFQWVISEGVIEGEKIILLKPTTFMNLSGESVCHVLHFYKLDPATDILVISDDIDMEFAKVRYRKVWSHGGQNGMRSIIEHLGSDQFSRIKVGIGRDDRYSVSDWVLSRFTNEEQKILQSEVFPEVCRQLTEWLHV